MPEKTQRGKEDHKLEEESINGEPVKATQSGEVPNGGQSANISRDKGIPPAKDTQRDGHGRKKD